MMDFPILLRLIKLLWTRYMLLGVEVLHYEMRFNRTSQAQLNPKRDTRMRVTLRPFQFSHLETKLQFHRRELRIKLNNNSTRCW